MLGYPLFLQDLRTVYCLRAVMSTHLVKWRAITRTSEKPHRVARRGPDRSIATALPGQPLRNACKDVSTPVSGLLPTLIASARCLRRITGHRASNAAGSCPCLPSSSGRGASGPRRSLCAAPVRATWGSRISGGLSSCCGAVLSKPSTPTSDAELARTAQKGKPAPPMAAKY